MLYDRWMHNPCSSLSEIFGPASMECMLQNGRWRLSDNDFPLLIALSRIVFGRNADEGFVKMLSLTRHLSRVLCWREAISLLKVSLVPDCQVTGGCNTTSQLLGVKLI